MANKHKLLAKCSCWPHVALCPIFLQEGFQFTLLKLSHGTWHGKHDICILLENLYRGLGYTVDEVLQCNRCTMHMLRFLIFELTIKCNHFHFTGVATSVSAVVAYWYNISLSPARSISHLPLQYVIQHLTRLYES